MVAPRVGRAFEIVAVHEGVAGGATAGTAVDLTVASPAGVVVEELTDVATVVDTVVDNVSFSATSRSNPAVPQEVRSFSSMMRPSPHNTFGASHWLTPKALRHVFQNSVFSEYVPSLHCATARSDLGAFARIATSSARPDTALDSPVITANAITTAGISAGGRQRRSFEGRSVNWYTSGLMGSVRTM
ncbi:MAG: hypothetical protein ABIQ73_00025 [Acidimicrobiales bacterium]